MEFKDVFGSVAIVFIAVFAVLSLTTDINNSWGTTIGDDFRSELSENNKLINSTLRSSSLAFSGSAQPEEGQNAEADAEQNIFRRGLNLINNIFSFINLPNKLIGVFLDQIPGFPSIIKTMAQYIFGITYYLTLGYLLILGRRSLS